MAANEEPLPIRARNWCIRANGAICKLHRLMVRSVEQPNFLSDCPDSLYPFARRFEHEILAVGGPITATLRLPPSGEESMQVAPVARYFPQGGTTSSRVP